MRLSIQQKIKSYLVKVFFIDQSQLTPNALLIDQWIWDSIHLLTIAQYLEQEFCLSLTAEDMESKNFATLDSLTNFVLRKIS